MSSLDLLYRDGWLRAVDHALALALRRLRPDTPDDVLVGAALASRALAFGHSGLPLAQASELFAEIAPEREPPALPPLPAWRAALLASPWVGIIATRGNALDASAPTPASPIGQPDGDTPTAAPFVFDHERLYLRRYWSYERRLAAALRARAAASIRPHEKPDASVDTLLAHLFPNLAHDPHDIQAVAARHLLHSRLLLLTGGPGTGKTTTVARALLLQVAVAMRAGRAAPRIALAAPTGKAAARLAEAVREAVQACGDGLSSEVVSAVPTAASTLHRLLGWRADSVDFRHDAAHPLPFDLVVVDEASMVDLPLMCKLVEAVAPDATLLLVGDRDQLPSVETGDVLAALCDAADAGGDIAMQRIALQRSWRQDDAIDVPLLAARVRDGDAQAALEGLREERFRGVRWQLGNERALATTLRAEALNAYRELQQAATPADGLRLARTMRVLTAVREGPSGSNTLNQLLAQSLQPPGQRSERFFHGALLIVTENSYRHGLFNGDIGLVWREPDGRGGTALRVWFERSADGGGDGALRAWLPAALPAHELAFALTVHKSQGSEFDHVLLVLPPATGPAGASRALSRELLYTGITRCRRSLLLWAEPDAVRAAVSRRAQRWSGLARRLA